MIEIKVPKSELWNDDTDEFVIIPETTLRMEHSLVSVSKWESKWHKPWLSKTQKTPEEQLSYYKFMTLSQNVPDTVYMGLSPKNIEDIETYISDPMTAAVFKDSKKGPQSNEFITAESLYYAMIQNGIPVEVCQKWHFNKLMALIHFFNAKGETAPKKGREEIINEYAAINARNRAKFRSKG